MLVCAATYALLALASVRSFWLPSGWALAIMILFGRSGWFCGFMSVLLGELIFDLTLPGNSWPMWIMLIQSLANGGCAALAAWSVSRILRGPVRLATMQQLAVLLGVGAFFGFFSAGVGAYYVKMLGSKRDLSVIWTAWHLRDFLGIMLTAPLALAWVQPVGAQDRTWDRNRKFEAFTLVGLLLLILASALSFGSTYGQVLRFGLVPFVMWAGFRFGLRGVTAVNVIIALGLGWLATEGYWVGDPSLKTAGERNIELQITLASIVLMGLVPAIVLQAQRESRDLLSLVFGAVSEAILVHDGEGRLLHSNPAAKNLIGTGTQGPGVAGIEATDWTDEEGRPLPASEFPTNVTLRSGEIIRNRIMGVRQERGREVMMEVSTEPLRDSNGKVTMVVTRWSDITAQRAASEQLRQAQKMELVGNLAGGIAHDFNNLLTAITMTVELFGMRHGTLPEVQTFSTKLQGLTQRAAAMTGQLLLFSRRSEARKQRFEANQRVSDLVSLLRPMLGERIKIDKRLAAEKIWIEGDASMIDQMVMNLSVNARDAMPEGGALAIETAVVNVLAIEPAEVVLLNARPGRFAQITLRDTGCGISRETMGKMFEPFFTTKPVGKGTGLGLSIVHSVVQQHEGWIRVRSQAGEGAEFAIFLPLSGELAVEGADEASVARGSGTILLVEDEGVVRDSCATILRSIGHEVLEAANGSEALEVWAKSGGRIDLLISDMVMPGQLSGVQLADRLRREKTDLKVIIVSGYSEEIARSEQANPVRHLLLPKPFEISALTAAIKKCMEDTKPASGPN